MWFVNMFVKNPLKELDLFKFEDEIVHIDPEERRQQALETALFHAKMSPQQIKRGKDGKPMIYGESH